MSDQQLGAFAVEIPVNDPEKMKEFQEAMNDYQDEQNKVIEELAKELGVSDACAMDVYYLRGRSRHTDELEKELIRLYAEGTPPNICEFGN